MFVQGSKCRKPSIVPVVLCFILLVASTGASSPQQPKLEESPVATALEQEDQQTTLRSLAGKPATQYPPTVHRCVHSTTKLAKQTAGGNPCFNCDPATNECNPGCQILIDGLYHVCSGMCLPDGYFFDPESNLEGCFNNVKSEFKIGVERCGCNSGFSLQSSAGGLGAFLIILLTLAFSYA